MTTETLITPVVYRGYNIEVMPIDVDADTRYYWHIWRVGEHGRIASEGKRTETAARKAAQRRVRQLEMQP